MSNIFQIDGEIEDNMDGDERDKNDPNKKKEEQESAAENELPIENAQNDDAASTELDSDNELEEESAETTEEDNHWYDKYITDDEKEVVQENDENSNEEVNALEEAEDEEDDLPSVEDISQEEIDEVLAELDEQEKELESQTDYDDEENLANEKTDLSNENSEEEIEESFDEIFPKSNKPPTPLGTYTFLVLFLITFSLFAYYQFYDGHSFSIDFTHKSEAGLSKIDSMSIQYETQINQINNQKEIIAELKEKVHELHKLNMELAEDTAANSGVLQNDGTPVKSQVDLNNGVYYQVQVIALQQYNPDFGKSDFSFYVDKEDGYSKMLIGAMSSENAVKELYSKVKRSGFNDAFIVKKVNGKRVEYDPYK